MNVRILRVSALLLATLIGFSSCKTQEEKPLLEKIQLKTPEPKFVDAGSTWAVLTWSQVEGALSYNIWFEGDDNPDIAIDTLFTLTGLNQNTNYRIRITAEPATQSNYKRSEKSAVLAFTTSSKPTLEAPQITLDTVTTTAFEAHWSTVEMVENYTYTFESEDAVTTTDTTVQFKELTPGQTYTLKVRANPTEEYAEEFDPSMWSTLKVTTNVPVNLTAPVITVERASCIHTTISWDEVANATGYRYTFGDADTVTTTSLSTYFEGLTEDSTYTFHIQAICDDHNIAIDSEWASAEFKAVDDFQTTLTVENASATDTSVTFTGKIAMEGETFAMGILPKANWIDAADATKIDTAAIIAMITGSTPTLYSTSTTLTFDKLYQGTTYLCYALSIDNNGKVRSDLKVAEAKVKEFEAAVTGTNYNTGDFAKIVTCHNYGYSSSVGIYGPTNYLNFKISNEQKDSKTLSEVKYYIWTASAFETKFGGTTSATAEAVKEYFQSSGSSLSQDKLNTINGGTAYSSGYASRSANTAYTMAMRAVTTDNDTLVCVSTLLTYKAGTDWLTLTSDQTSGVKITIKSELPIVSGTYSMVKLTTSNNTPELIRSYNLPNSLRTEDITNINQGTGITKSYPSLSAASTYNFIIRVVNAAGDEITRNIIVRTN